MKIFYLIKTILIPVNQGRKESKNRRQNLIPVISIKK